MKDGVTNSVPCGFWKSQRVCTNEKRFPLWFCPINSIWIVVFRQQFRLDLGIVGFDSGEFSPVGSKAFLHKTVSKIISEITDRLFYLKVRLIPPMYFMKIRPTYRINPLPNIITILHLNIFFRMVTVLVHFASFSFPISLMLLS